MGAMDVSSGAPSQWIFPVSALHSTPSCTTSGIPLEKELYDRARGVEFLFRLGVSLALPSSAMYTAATWFHRFFMRYSMEDYHRQDVAASCIFLATKTEECGRKLRDVAKIYCSKVSKIDPKEIQDDSREVEESQAAILLTEEVLLEALCFDFIVDSPHTSLVDLLEARAETLEVEEYAWSIANDSYRTPLCILFPPKIIAAACYILAQQVVEGPQSVSLATRIASPAPSASLPTPPSQKPVSPETARFAVEYFQFNEVELASVGDALAILLEFYSAQDIQGMTEYLAGVAAVPPPSTSSSRVKLYLPFAHVAQGTIQNHNTNPAPTDLSDQSPDSTKEKSSSRDWKSVTDGPPRRPDMT